MGRRAERHGLVLRAGRRQRARADERRRHAGPVAAAVVITPRPWYLVENIRRQLAVRLPVAEPPRDKPFRDVELLKTMEAALRAP
jgi:hypothetical protein